jgi:hypothetical protein
VTQGVLLFSAVVGLVVGAFGLLVAAREPKNAASWWGWVVLGLWGAAARHEPSEACGCGMSGRRRSSLFIIPPTGLRAPANTFVVVW